MPRKKLLAMQCMQRKLLAGQHKLLRRNGSILAQPLVDELQRREAMRNEVAKKQEECERGFLRCCDKCDISFPWTMH
jgi:hypothetical protein